MAVLTVKQTAHLFQVSPRTVIDMIERGEIFARKIGGHWRIPAAPLYRWIGGWTTQSAEREGPAHIAQSQ